MTLPVASDPVSVRAEAAADNPLPGEVARSGLDDGRIDEALLRLVLAGGAVAPRRRLLDTHRTSAAALAAGRRNWRSHGFDDVQSDALQSPDAEQFGRCMDWFAASPRHRLLGWQDPDYPPLLRRIAARLCSHRPSSSTA